MKNKVKNVIFIFLSFILSSLFSSFLFIFFTSFGGNIQINKFTVNFNPLITIAYLMEFYFINEYFNPSKRAKFFLFLFTLFLSFSVSFIQGSSLLILFYFFLKMFKIVQSKDTENMSVNSGKK